MRKRRGNGEGTVFQRKEDGLWVGTASIKDAYGKSKRVTVYAKTQKEVNEKLTLKKTEAMQGMLPDAQGHTIQSFMTKWLEDVIRPQKRISTYVGYEVIVRKHICPRIGTVRLANLRPDDVTAMLADMNRSGLSKRMQQNTHSVLSGALRQAMRWKYMPRNVCEVVDRPAPAKHNFTPLTQKEVVRFLDVAQEDRLYAVYVLAVYTAMRQGEIFGLQWADVNLEDGLLTVRNNLTEVKGKLELGEPKTSKGRRRIKLTATVLQALKAHREAMATEGTLGDMVFCDTNGGFLRKGNFLRRSFKPMLAKAGLPEIRFHDLRHTCASILLAENEHPKVVQELLGHSTISLTLDLYSHILPTISDVAANTMERVLKQANA